jgi:hypothetical protein
LAFWEANPVLQQRVQTAAGLVVLEASAADSATENAASVACALSCLGIPRTVSQIEQFETDEKTLAQWLRSPAARRTWAWMRLAAKATVVKSTGTFSAAAVAGRVVSVTQQESFLNGASSTLGAELVQLLDSGSVDAGAMSDLILAIAPTEDQRVVIMGMLTHECKDVKKSEEDPEASAGALWNSLMSRLEVSYRDILHAQLCAGKGERARDGVMDVEDTAAAVKLVRKMNTTVFTGELWRFSSHQHFFDEKMPASKMMKSHPKVYDEALENACFAWSAMWGSLVTGVGAQAPAEPVGAHDRGWDRLFVAFTKFVDTYALVDPGVDTWPGGANAIVEEFPIMLIDRWAKQVKASVKSVAGSLPAGLVPGLDMGTVEVANPSLMTVFNTNVDILRRHLRLGKKPPQNVAEMKAERMGGSPADYASAGELKRMRARLDSLEKGGGGGGAGGGGSPLKRGGRECFDFQKGFCKYGADCKFVHAGSPGGQGQQQAASWRGRQDMRIDDRSPEKGICFDFQQGNCRRGNSCKFSHGSAAGNGRFIDMKGGGDQVCYDHQKGECYRGSNCRFSHATGGGGGGGGGGGSGGAQRPLNFLSKEDLNKARDDFDRIWLPIAKKAGFANPCLRMSPMGPGRCTDHADCIRASKRDVNHEPGQQVDVPTMKLIAKDKKVRALFAKNGATSRLRMLGASKDFLKLIDDE